MNRVTTLAGRWCLATLMLELRINATLPMLLVHALDPQKSFWRFELWKLAWLCDTALLNSCRGGFVKSNDEHT